MMHLDGCARQTVGIVAVVLMVAGPAAVAVWAGAAHPLQSGLFRWRTGPPLLLPKDVPGDHLYSVKDPTIVRHEGWWHLFYSIRGQKRSHATQYVSFAEWDEANDAPRTVLGLHDGFFCAPQVFYFTPHRRWYLLCQASDDSWDPEYGPAVSTTRDIADPGSWSPLTPLFREKPDNVQAWLDFWIICDEEKAHLFFTSLNGRMWRAETALGDFPHGWSRPVVALQGDVFEASHTYRIKGTDRYLTLIEAQGGHGWRYFKAYLADSLDGEWRPLAAERDNAFASMRNVRQTGPRWTNSISHGELIRAGSDEKLEVDPERLAFVFQGVLDRDRAGKKYGEIPWSLGLLRPDW